MTVAVRAGNGWNVYDDKVVLHVHREYYVMLLC